MLLSALFNFRLLSGVARVGGAVSHIFHIIDHLRDGKRHTEQRESYINYNFPRQSMIKIQNENDSERDNADNFSRPRNPSRRRPPNQHFVNGNSGENNENLSH